MSKTSDVLVVGAGPAGLAFAAAAATRGLAVSVLAPGPRDHWQRSFGIWARGAAGLGLQDAIASRSTEPVVHSGVGQPRVLDATYLRLDTKSLQTLLLDRCVEAGVEFVDGRVDAVMHASDSSEVRVSGTARPVFARLVVDATGSASTLSARDRPRPRAYQSAYGLWLEAPSPFSPGDMALMDFRPLPGVDGPLTFLYGLREGQGRIFLQETCLASARPIAFERLSARLEIRLEKLGLSRAPRLGSERCLIPMGVGLPLAEQSILPFGAAAGLVHPATGYQLARALQTAPILAESVAKDWSLERDALVASSLEALWPAHLRHEFGLYDRGLGLMLGLGPEQMRAFIRAFFELPTPLWLGFMEGTLSVREIAAAMWQVFSRAPLRLRFELLRGSAISGAEALLSAAS